MRILVKLGNLTERLAMDEKTPQKVTLSIRALHSTATDLKAVAAEEGANLSETGETAITTWLRDRRRAPALIAEAAELAFGPANAGLVRLIAEVIREVAPRGGDWLDHPADFANLARGVARLFARLRAGEHDPHTIRDRSVEGRVDALLYHLGDDGSAHPGAPTARQEWAASVRQHLGEALSARLIAMTESVRDYHEQMAPDDPFSSVNPADVDTWDRVREPVLRATAEVRAREADERRRARRQRRAQPEE
jgi:hypothetical protein